MDGVKIPTAQEAHLQSASKNGPLAGLIREINTRINVALENGEFSIRYEWIITGPRRQEMYIKAIPNLRLYYQAKGYHFDADNDTYVIRW